MPEVSASSFDRLPYRHGAVPETHPARIGAIARLLGLPVAAADRCRVLELGCGEGMNLLPLAERLPGSTFVGVDFSTAHLAMADQARAAAGIGNAEFIHADLGAYEPEAGVFDYVIAHGVYSWVPAEIRERLLALCARALAPEGVAYVSYHTHPGWGMVDGLRAMLRAELAEAADPVAHLARVLPALERGLAGQTGTMAVLLRETLAEWRSRPPELLLHDELETVCEPTTFLDFTAHAARHGLHYLAEAHFASMPPEHLPPPARQALAELAPDFHHAQHYLDLLGQRRFRNSLLTRCAPSPDRVLDPAVIPQCAVGLHLQPAGGRIDLTPGTPLLLAGRHGFQMSVTAPSQKAFFAALCEVAPARVPFPSALARAATLLKQSGHPANVDPALLAAGVAKLFAADQCDLLLTGETGWLDLSPQPAPSPLMRHQARTGLHVASRWHEVIELSDEDRRWVAGEASSDREAALLRTGLAV